MFIISHVGFFRISNFKVEVVIIFFQKSIEIFCSFLFATKVMKCAVVLYTLIYIFAVLGKIAIIRTILIIMRIGVSTITIANKNNIISNAVIISIIQAIIILWLICTINIWL